MANPLLRGVASLLCVLLVESCKPLANAPLAFTRLDPLRNCVCYSNVLYGLWLLTWLSIPGKRKVWKPRSNPPAITRCVTYPRHNALNKTIELINENTLENKKHKVCAVWTKRQVYWHEVYCCIRKHTRSHTNSQPLNPFVACTGF